MLVFLSSIAVLVAVNVAVRITQRHTHDLDAIPHFHVAA